MEDKKLNLKENEEWKNIQNNKKTQCRLETKVGKKKKGSLCELFYIIQLYSHKAIWNSGQMELTILSLSVRDVWQKFV